MSEQHPVLPDGRKYQILDVIGRGGFGNVYRARLEGGDGFFKDVAIKIAREADAPAEALERFRDEARILGLVRDRALVGVDPPMRLDGRWAVVMEYVDGASCSRLLVRYGAVPPTVAMEIGAEIARLLHKIYRHPGRDGQPLRLVHRDIKPANIQITPTGEVKLLDFGIARAEFRDRESVTVMTIGGTRGYIAPERATGLEAPSGDVYSLGVVLYKLVVGKLPEDDDLGWEPGDPEPANMGDPRDMVLGLARKMRCLRPNLRPTAEDVHRLLQQMRQRSSGESLEQWAKRVVPDVSRLAEDELVGTTLSEADETAPTLQPRGRRSLWAALVVVLLGAAAALVVFAPEPKPDPTTPVPEQPVPVEPADVEPAPGPPDPAPEATPRTQPTVPRIPAPAVPVTPVVPDAAPAPEPVGAPPATLLPVRITSIPMGAEVRVDGRVVGQTPLLDLALPEGAHNVEISADQALIRRTIEVGPGLPDRFVWRVATGSWEKGF